MKTKILMVYPKIPVTFWSLDNLLPYFGKKSLLPPLGLLHVASLLPDNYEVKLIDMNTKPLTSKDVEEADLVFISAMTIQQNSFDEVVKLCNDCNTTVVAGGAHPWSSLDKIKGVDHFVLNEAEITLPKFLSDYENGTLQKIYTDSTKPEINEIPKPRLDLIDVNDYVSMPIQYSRGCPFNCEFCDIIEMFGRKVRTKTPEQFIKELDAVYETGFSGSIFVVDDNFIGNKKKSKELLRSIIKWQKEKSYPYSIYTEASMDLARDEELMLLMKEAGFNMVFIGIESPDNDTLNAIQKKQNTRDDMLESIKKIQSNNIIIMGGFIIGFDTDSEDIFDKQIDFIQEAGIPIAMVGLLAAMPNTQLWRRLEKENRIIGDGHHSGNNVDICLNFIPKIPERTLVEGYKRVLSELYKPKNLYDRYLTLLSHIPEEAPVRKGRMFPPDMSFWKKLNLSKNYFLIIFKQIFSSYGLDYIRFVKKALSISKINSLPIIFLGTSGFHYFDVAQRIINTEYISSNESNKSGVDVNADKGVEGQEKDKVIAS